METAKNRKQDVMFNVITKYTKYCARCGHNYDMRMSGHHHLPFCKKCRENIITNEYGTPEKVQ